jgi:hypothetical protein
VHPANVVSRRPVVFHHSRCTRRAERNKVSNTASMKHSSRRNTHWLTRNTVINLRKLTCGKCTDGSILLLALCMDASILSTVQTFGDVLSTFFGCCVALPIMLKSMYAERLLQLDNRFQEAFAVTLCHRCEDGVSIVHQDDH